MISDYRPVIVIPTGCMHYLAMSSKIIHYRSMCDNIVNGNVFAFTFVFSDLNPRIASVTPFTLSTDITFQDSTTMDMETANPSTEPITPSGAAENLIPVYCSILAAVIVGLVAFIVFKRSVFHSSDLYIAALISCVDYVQH